MSVTPSLMRTITAGQVGPGLKRDRCFDFPPHNLTHLHTQTVCSMQCHESGKHSNSFVTTAPGRVFEVSLRVHSMMCFAPQPLLKDLVVCSFSAFKCAARRQVDVSTVALPKLRFLDVNGQAWDRLGLKSLPVRAVVELHCLEGRQLGCT